MRMPTFGRDDLIEAVEPKPKFIEIRDNGNGYYTEWLIRKLDIKSVHMINHLNKDCEIIVHLYSDTKPISYCCDGLDDFEEYISYLKSLLA